MFLKDYISGLDKKYRKVFFSGISFESSRVKKDNIFFAIKGDRFDGNDYIDEAISRGASVIISEKQISKKKKNIIYLNSLNIRKVLAEISYKIFKDKPKKLVAVTGTNGKSSVTDFYFQILNLNLKKVASIGTIGVRYQNKKKKLNNTTLDPIQLGKILKNLKKKKLSI